MIYSETKLDVSDNSGAKLAKCIKVLKNSKSSGAKPAHQLVISVKKLKSNKSIKKGQVCKAVLVRGKKNVQRKNGLSIKFNSNALIIVDQKNLPIASRILGPIYKEFRLKDTPKILSLAKTVI